jgi:hypothetical protein
MQRKVLYALYSNQLCIKNYLGGGDKAPQAPCSTISDDIIDVSKYRA